MEQRCVIGDTVRITDRCKLIVGYNRWSNYIPEMDTWHLPPNNSALVYVVINARDGYVDRGRLLYLELRHGDNSPVRYTIPQAAVRYVGNTENHEGTIRLANSTIKDRFRANLEKRLNPPKCEHCGKNIDDCECETCEHCGETLDNCGCGTCEHCGETLDNCDCAYCEHCGENINYCDCERN